MKLRADAGAMWFLFVGIVFSDGRSHIEHVRMMSSYEHCRRAAQAIERESHYTAVCRDMGADALPKLDPPPPGYERRD